MVWKQLEITLPAHRRGCHLLTKVLEQHIRADLAAINVGLCHVFSEPRPRTVAPQLELAGRIGSSRRGRGTRPGGPAAT